MSEEIVSETPEIKSESEQDVDRTAPDPAVDESNAAVDGNSNPAAEPELTVDQELAKAKDLLLRTTAEFQNYRRRTEQSRVSDTALGKSIVLQEMLGVFDDLGRSLDAAKDLAGNQDVDVRSSYEALRSGMNLVHKNFSDQLVRLGLSEIEAVGTPFDESLHEALMQQPAPDGVEPGTVLTEIQKGYMFGDKVLRHSKVIVAQ